MGCDGQAVIPSSEEAVDALIELVTEGETITDDVIDDIFTEEDIFTVIDTVATESQYGTLDDIPAISINRGIGLDLSAGSSLFDRASIIPDERFLTVYRSTIPTQTQNLLCQNLPTTIIRRGDSGQDAAWAQRFMTYVMRGDVIVDGVYGRRSKATMQKIQNVLDVSADGHWGPRTQQAAKAYLGCS